MFYPPRGSEPCGRSGTVREKRSGWLSPREISVNYANRMPDEGLGGQLAMAVAELTMLGGFGIRAASDAAAKLLGQKEKALLAFLALPPGVPHSREKLASLLWSDRGDPQARDSLKHALTRLRQCLQRAGPSAIIADRQSVKLDPAAVSTDVAAFERLLGGGSSDAIEQGIALYRGDLLDGISIRDAAFEEWLLVERQRLRRLLEGALTTLITQAMAVEGRARAETAAQRLLALDPLREPATRALMQLHAERGEATQGLKLYETLRDRLQRELGVKPEPETTRLYEAIREHRIPLPGGTRMSTGDSGAKSTPGSHTAAPLPLPDKPSIAVLPFENLSGDPEQQYFSDGITEDIIIDLSRFRSLFVIARNSSFAFKGRSIKVQDIARELGVAYIVEGSVRRAGDRVRINAQLVDAGTGNHLWAERYERDMGDIFALQDEVARSVASTVSGRVEVGRPGSGRTAQCDSAQGV